MIRLHGECGHSSLNGPEVPADWARQTAGTAVTSDYIERWFLPSLLPIAAGYHVAHFLGYLLKLSPALFAAVIALLTPPANL